MKVLSGLSIGNAQQYQSFHPDVNSLQMINPACLPTVTEDERGLHTSLHSYAVSAHRQVPVLQVFSAMARLKAACSLSIDFCLLYREGRWV